MSSKFGLSTDIPVTGDWDGDGTTEIGVYRPSTGLWYLDSNGNNAFNNGVDTVSGKFGVSTDKPATGDWNSGGITEIGVYHPSNGFWYLDTSSNNSWDNSVDTSSRFGLATDIPVTGKW